MSNASVQVLFITSERKSIIFYSYHCFIYHISVRGYAAGTFMDISEPGEHYRELLSKKQALEMEIRQRQVTTPNHFMGSKLAVSLTSTRGAVRLALASGPGLVVIT